VVVVRILRGEGFKEWDERCEIELDVEPWGQGMLILFGQVKGQVDERW